VALELPVVVVGIVELPVKVGVGVGLGLGVRVVSVMWPACGDPPPERLRFRVHALKSRFQTPPRTDCRTVWH